jgi:hypothetical protein
VSQGTTIRYLKKIIIVYSRTYLFLQLDHSKCSRKRRLGKSLGNVQQMRQGTCGFFNVFQILPLNVSASCCHLQGGHRCLRSYSSNVCVVGVYGLESVQCGQLSWNVSKCNWSHWMDHSRMRPQHIYCSNSL